MRLVQDEEDGFPMLSMDALLELNVPIYLSLVKEDQVHREKRLTHTHTHTHTQAHTHTHRERAREREKERERKRRERESR